MIQELDKKEKVYPSERTSTYFALMIEDKLPRMKFEQLLKLPVMINKLRLDTIPLKDANGEETTLTSKLIAELESRPGNEKTDDGTFRVSARSVQTL